MTIVAYKRWQILLTFLALLVLASSFYFQYVKQLEPCPLCLMQRLCVFLLFMVCFIGVTLRSLKAAKRVVFLQFVFAGLGLFFAFRQLWLQSLPLGQTPACMPGLEVLIHYFPWQEVLRSLFWGTGECAKESWRWLGLTMPAWTAVIFLFYLLAALFVFILLRNQERRFHTS